MKRLLICLSILFYQVYFSQAASEASISYSVPEDIAQKFNYEAWNDENKLMTIPEFPGGISEFRKEFANNFDTSALQKVKGQVSTIVYFSIETDGKILQVFAQGNNAEFNQEAERTVRSIKKTWTPAKKNGAPIRYIFQVPLKMQFE
ncbi:energy transducer TonB [Chryseobacterium sp. CCH4-E10]|jgi:protein TonB|uniref:energy transducer TonB n=1 Tax=Chryseobacterium sp. CCH4-E10 TaxID=1768758 RepID=UPI00082C03EE|nr:energy transducer TonB [Chryseobacterium sp. CCH4-E10]